MASNRLARTNDDIQRVISSLLRNVKDPRVQQGMISVTRVETTGDLRYSKIWLSVMGMKDEKEFKKGLVVGQPTAGYGTKDEVIPLSDGSAITLSVANYLTPGGTVFNGVGIAADISATLTEEQMDLLARDELAHTDDAQLQAAVSALVRQGAAVAEIPGTQSAQGTDAIPEEAGEGSATGEDAASSEGTQLTEESSTSSSTAG